MSDYRRRNSYSSNSGRPRQAGGRRTPVRQGRRRRPTLLDRLKPVILVALMMVVLSVPVVWAVKGNIFKDTAKKNQDVVVTNGAEAVTKSVPEQISELTAKAQTQAAQYDFDGAINSIKKARKLDAKAADLKSLLVEYTASKDDLVEWTGDVEHVFFHQLIVDPTWCFDTNQNSDSAILGINQVMTTITEFKKMMQSMYDKGYMLIKFSDIYDVSVDKTTGKSTYSKKTLMLPKGKKPLIISQDDVNFYSATTEQYGGFGTKFVLDENGAVKILYTDRAGNDSVGDYDMVPVLDTFVAEHPDFSYKGAKGYIGLTGYDGALGYRTQIDNKNKATYKEDQEMVKKIAEACKANGWEFASHSYGHGHMSAQTITEVKEDAQMWHDEVESLVGETNVYLFPYGDWGQNETSTYQEKLDVLMDAGFIFLNGVGVKTYNADKDGYVFQDRANLDGQCMYNRAEYLQKFFTVSEIWDSARPADSSSLLY